jgi:hypothetical protein
MNRFRFTAGLLLCVVVAGSSALVRAQNLTMDFVYGGIEDAEKILQEYLRPYANVLGADLNAGWYNTARPHKLGGLDVTATVSWAKAPLSALSFDVNELNLSENAVTSPDGLAPTIAGKQESRPEVSYSQSVDMGGGSQDVEYARYTLPDGTGVDFFPLPMGQLTVGLPLGTDVSARFVPLVGFRDYGQIGLWGVGGKHSISQWLPFIKRLKFLDISLQGGYTKVTSSVNVSVEPLDVEVLPDRVYDWNDQFVIQKVEGWSMNLISSQTLAVLTIYQGIGYASSLVELELEGHYPIHSVITEEGEDLGKTTYLVVEDPIEMKYENFNNLRVNVGARIKLGVLTLHYDFTHTLYATHSVGVGISFR